MTETELLFEIQIVFAMMFGSESQTATVISSQSETMIASVTRSGFDFEFATDSRKHCCFWIEFDWP